MTNKNGNEISPLAIIEQPENVIIGNNVKIKPGVVIRPETGKIYIGNNVVINHYTVIHGKGGVEIGDWSIIAPNCSIMAQNHSFDSFDQPITLQPNHGIGITLMGDNWLGAGCVILDGVTLGKGTIVGAGAVVSRSFPMAKVVAGNPARIIRDRKESDHWDFNQDERYSEEKTPQDYLPYVQKRIDFVLSQIRETDKILDIGCGEGFITHQMSKTSPSITGIDYSKEATEAATRKYPQIAFAHMTATNLNFSSHSFDKVVFLEVLEHLTLLQAPKVLAEIFRVLKPGGMIVGSTPLRSTQKSEPSCYAHIYEYSEEELIHLLRLFEEVKITGQMFFVGRK